MAWWLIVLAVAVPVVLVAGSIGPLRRAFAAFKANPWTPRKDDDDDW